MFHGNKKERTLRYALSSCLFFLILLFDLVEFVEYNVVQYFDVGSLHAGRARLNHACTLELAQCIHNDGSCDTHAVGNLACHKDSLLAVHLIKNMNDRFQFRK